MIPAHRQRGLTLIELMLSMTLGLLLLVGIASLFLQSNRSNRQNELIAGLQDQGRFALATLSRDLMMAGYWGGMYGASNATVNSALATILPPSTDCGSSLTSGWAFDLGSRLGFRNQDSATATIATWRCIANQLAGTDTVSVRHVAGQPALLTQLQANRYYLQTNAIEGTVMRWSGALDTTNKPLNPPMAFYKYAPRIYFVRDYSHSLGDGLPALCRKQLGATASIETECIADGVEDLQLSWGLDTDADGIADRYTSTPSDIQMRDQAVVAQLSLLLRSRQTDGAHRDERTYLLGDKAAYSPNDRHYRRVFSTTVQLRNPVN